MMVDLLRAVEHVHAYHFIDMDIATDNILFRCEGNSGGDSLWAARIYARAVNGALAKIVTLLQTLC